MGTGEWRKGDRIKYSCSCPGESQEGTRGERGNPGFTRSPHPVRRPPAGSAPSAGATPTAAPSPPGGEQGERFPAHLSSSGVWSSPPALRQVSTRKPVTSSRRMRALGRAPHSCVREAASPWKGHSSGASSSLGVPPLTLSPGAGRGDQRDLSKPHRPSPDQHSSGPGLPKLVWALGAAPGLPPFHVSFRTPQPFLPVLAVHTQNHTTKITSIGIAPEGQTGRALKPGGKRRDPEARKAQSRQTC